MLDFLNPFAIIRKRRAAKEAEVLRLHNAEVERRRYYEEQTRKLDELRAKRAKKEASTLTAKNAVAADRKLGLAGEPKRQYSSDYASNSDGASIPMLDVTGAMPTFTRNNAFAGLGGTFDGAGANGDWESDRPTATTSSSCSATESSSSSSSSSASCSSDSGSSSGGDSGGGGGSGD